VTVVVTAGDLRHSLHVPAMDYPPLNCGNHQWSRMGSDLPPYPREWAITAEIRT